MNPRSYTETLMRAVEDGGGMEDEEMVVPTAESGSRGSNASSSEECPFRLLRDAKASAESIVAEMLSIKRDGKPKSLLRELISQMLLQFLNLRQINRSILVEEERVRSETENAKVPLESTTLQLHNLMYEKSYYVKAIKACKELTTKYPDIELVSEEEFFRDAPEEVKGCVLSNHSAHDLMLKRLNFELSQRKKLCKLHEKLEQKKKTLSETIAKRKKFLSTLPSNFKPLKKASLPVQNQLGLEHTKKIKRHHSAELLPQPLYVIFSQLSAQKEAFGEAIDLEIIGSVKDAQALAHHQALKDNGISTGSELEDDEHNEDAQRPGKRLRRVQDRESLDQAGIFEVHPLQIVLHVYDNEVSELKSAKLITLKFEYILQLNIICVGTEESNNGPENDILCNLFPDDTGCELPHQSAKLFVGDSIMFIRDRTSRPYKWAQHLAGINFLPEVSPLLLMSRETQENSDAAKDEDVISGFLPNRQHIRVHTILQRIRSRRKTQLALS
ncbi:THO complex subunit 5A [Arachis ipaensis]|uniref:THO complex subunit 5A n=1 Tax=Arachis ipaensis TaxID=130454 RepID=UPI0007AF1F35|nr:THO complex subunit 5A [Arachis ipaensis]